MIDDCGLENFGCIWIQRLVVRRQGNRHGWLIDGDKLAPSRLETYLSFLRIDQEGMRNKMFEDRWIRRMLWVELADITADTNDELGEFKFSFRNRSGKECPVKFLSGYRRFGTQYQLVVCVCDDRLVNVGVSGVPTILRWQAEPSKWPYFLVQFKIHCWQLFVSLEDTVWT